MADPLASEAACEPAAAQPIAAEPGRALAGTATVPGDKSVSHRALILGALAVGPTTIAGLLEGADVLATAGALRKLGCEIARDGSIWRVHGRGVGGLAAPDDMLDLGNSGTAARLLMGVAAGHSFVSFFTGDASLRRRPMARVTRPLAEMGAEILASEGGRLPLAVIGSDALLPCVYRLPVASAQVKSAILLAGLHAPGATTVIENRPTRDHTETILRHFGAEVTCAPAPDGGQAITVRGQPELTGRALTVPADPSSAAFPAVAALCLPGSDVTLNDVGINPLRFGLFQTLIEMGADLAIADRRRQAGEDVADLVCRGGALSGVDVPAERAPAMIDEYPALAVAASCARGPTRLRGLGELRVKESDRFAGILEGLARSGVRAEEIGDDIVIYGCGGPPPGGAGIAARMDHRIAMAFLVMGLVARAPVEIDDGRTIETSFPGFVSLMTSLGARLRAMPARA